MNSLTIFDDEVKIKKLEERVEEQARQLEEERRSKRKRTDGRAGSPKFSRN